MHDFVSFKAPITEEIKSLGKPKVYVEEYNEDGSIKVFKFQVECISDTFPTENGVIYDNLKETWHLMEGMPFIDSHDIFSWKSSLGHVEKTMLRQKKREGKEVTIGDAIVDVDPAETDFIRKVQREDLPFVSIHAVASKAKKQKDGIIRAIVDYYRELSSVLTPGYRDSKILGMYAESIAHSMGGVKTAPTIHNAIAAYEAIKKLEKCKKKKKKSSDEEPNQSKTKQKKPEKERGTEKVEDEKLLDSLKEALEDPKKKSVLEGLVENQFFEGDSEDTADPPEGDDAGEETPDQEDQGEPEKNEESVGDIKALTELKKELESIKKEQAALKAVLKERRKLTGLPGKEKDKLDHKGLTEKVKAAYPSIYGKKE